MRAGRRKCFFVGRIALTTVALSQLDHVTSINLSPFVLSNRSSATTNWELQTIAILHWNAVVESSER